MQITLQRRRRTVRGPPGPGRTRPDPTRHAPRPGPVGSRDVPVRPADPGQVPTREREPAAANNRSQKAPGAGRCARATSARKGQRRGEGKATGRGIHRGGGDGDGDAGAPVNEGSLSAAAVGPRALGRALGGR